MKVIRLLGCGAAGAAVTGLYAVLPFAAGLRSWLGGLLLPGGLAALTVAVGALGIVGVLRRIAPLTVPPAALLAMPHLPAGSAGPGGPAPAAVGGGPAVPAPEGVSPVPCPGGPPGAGVRWVRVS